MNLKQKRIQIQSSVSCTLSLSGTGEWNQIVCSVHTVARKPDVLKTTDFDLITLKNLKTLNITEMNTLFLTALLHKDYMQYSLI